MRRDSGVVIVGGGAAGAHAALTLRRLGYPGPISLICGEGDTAPYHRPPLSKAYLQGRIPPADLSVAADILFTRKGIDIVRDPALRLDLGLRRVRLASGAALPYRSLILATGARARRPALPGADSEDTFTLRSLRDAERLRARLASSTGENVVVVGAGFLGMEFAATARSLGHHVLVGDRMDRVMGAQVSPATSAALTAMHRASGVRFRLGAEVRRLWTREGRVQAVRWADGGVVPASLVLFAVGAVPRTELAADAGLEVGSGVVVDENLQARPGVFAIGDCAQTLTGCAPTAQTALDQAEAAAAVIARPGSAPPASRPWFWSDQASAKIQICGTRRAGMRWLCRGEPERLDFSVFGFDAEGRCGVIESVNQPRVHASARAMLAGDTPLWRDVVNDASLAELTDLVRLAAPDATVVPLHRPA